MKNKPKKIRGPYIHPDHHKSKQINFRVTGYELTYIENCAKQQNLSVASFIRTAIASYNSKPATEKETIK